VPLFFKLIPEKMLFARVVGTVVATNKDPQLEGFKLLVLQVVDAFGKDTSQYVVAVDSVGAGMHEIVLFVTGSSARQTPVTEGKPVDATVMAIVDNWDINNKEIFNKSV